MEVVDPVQPGYSWIVRSLATSVCWHVNNLSIFKLFVCLHCELLLLSLWRMKVKGCSVRGSFHK